MSSQSENNQGVASAVNDILEKIKSTDTPKPSTKKSNKKEEKKTAENIPRGRPKSGKIWKTPKKKFSTLKKAKGAYFKTFEEKQKLRNDLKEMRETSKALRQQKIDEKEALKERRRQNIKRAEENRKKAEIVQVITNSKKLKRMKKKQLRFIEKRDTTQVAK